MKYGSVCSGIEAATVAWHPLGWRPSFFSEIDPNPRTVLAHHYPDVPLHGDFTTIQADQYDAIDLLVGGTPCQSFSVAGLRGGLADDRGNLALEYLRLAQRLRPRWLVWENVPGVLSSAGGRDFGSILGGLVELGYGFAYRVLDAQFVRVDGFRRAVPQRRRRVFVVGYLGDWRRAAAVLFERQSLRGDPAPRRQAGERPSATVSQGAPFGRTGNERVEAEAYIATISTALRARDFKGTAMDVEEPTLVAQVVADTLTVGANQMTGFPSGDVVAHALRAEGLDASEDGTGRGTPLVPVAFDTTAQTITAGYYYDFNDEKKAASHLVGHNPHAIVFSCKDNGRDATTGAAPTLRSMGHADSHQNGGGQLAVAFDTTQITSPTNRNNPQPGDPCHPLAAGAHPPAVAWPLSEVDSAWNSNGLGIGEAGDPCPTLQAGKTHSVATGWAVRRLTPRECERLQGFPDDYTLVPTKRGLMADGPRYKMLGNSMAVNVMRWIGRRIEAVEAIPSTEMLEAAE